MSDEETPKPPSPPSAQVIDLGAEKRARGLRDLVERRARQPVIEWLFYLEEDAKKFSIEQDELRKLIETVIKDNEKRATEERREQREGERKEQTAQRDDERKRRDLDKRARSLIAVFRLPTSEHESELRRLARRLDTSYEALRAEFTALLEEEKRKTGGGVEPWPEQVEAGAMLDELSAQLERYLIIHQPGAATAMTLWTSFSWVHQDIATFSPILVIQSADADAAKTTACKLIALLTPRAHVIAESTGPSLYRFVDRMHPTLIVDEADQLLVRRTDLAHIINVSWTKGTHIHRVGSNGEVHSFDPFCPKILSGIDLLAHLKPATRTRCISINLWPKLPGETVTNFRHAAEDERFFQLRRKLLRWSLDNATKLRKATPVMPPGFTNRQEENFALLLAIADLAGGDWPKKARTAATLLSQISEPSLGKLLLADMRDLFTQHGKKLTSKQVVKLLTADEEGEWANYQNRGPITQWTVARLLKPYGIQPRFIWLTTKQQERGYEAAWFETAFRHYLPAPPKPPKGRS
jgi:hypothetical protein